MAAIRVLLCGVTGLCALSWTTAASGAYTPTLLVGETSPALGGSGPVRIFVQTRDDDDATGLITLYAPRGYGVKLDHPADTELGTVIAFVRTGSLSAPRVAVQGRVKADNPADYVSNTCAPGSHDAVWRVDFILAGTAYRVPLYVDRLTSGPEAAYASARLQLCLASPYVARPQAVSLTYADLTIDDVFTNPGQQGTYAWNGVFVPYTPGTASLNAALTAQSTAYIGLPGTFVVLAKRQLRGRRAFALVTACLREAGQAVRGIRVRLYYGGRTVFSSKRVASPLTNAHGCATARIRLRKLLILFASARVPVRGASGCAPSLAPRCTSASTYPPSGRFRPVRITR